jgi:hypothetical protein
LEDTHQKLDVAIKNLVMKEAMAKISDQKQTCMQKTEKFPIYFNLIYYLFI